MTTDPLGRATGAGCIVQFGGKSYVLSPLLLQDIGSIRNTCAQSIDPFKPLMSHIDAMPEALQKHAWDQAHTEYLELQKKGISDKQFASWLLSDEGVTTLMWFGLRKQNESLKTRESIEDLLANVEADEIAQSVKALFEISGLAGEPKNPTNEQKNETPSRSTSGQDESANNEQNG